MNTLGYIDRVQARGGLQLDHAERKIRIPFAVRASFVQGATPIWSGAPPGAGIRSQSGASRAGLYFALNRKQPRRVMFPPRDGGYRKRAGKITSCGANRQDQKGATLFLDDYGPAVRRPHDKRAGFVWLTVSLSLPERRTPSYPCVASGDSRPVWVCCLQPTRTFHASTSEHHSHMKTNRKRINWKRQQERERHWLRTGEWKEPARRKVLKPSLIFGFNTAS